MLSDDDGASFVNDYVLSDEIFSAFLEFSRKEGFVAKDNEIKKSGEMLSNRIKALIARNLFETGSYFEILAPMDREINKALEVFEEKTAFNQIR